MGVSPTEIGTTLDTCPQNLHRLAVLIAKHTASWSRFWKQYQYVVSNIDVKLFFKNISISKLDNSTAQVDVFSVPANWLCGPSSYL